MNTLNFINISRTVCVRAVREESIENICIICICIVLFTSNALFLSCKDTNKNAKNQIFSCLFFDDKKNVYKV